MGDGVDVAQDDRSSRRMRRSLAAEANARPGPNALLPGRAAGNATG